MSLVRLAILFLCIGLVVSACNPVVNFFSFHPDPRYEVPPDRFPADTEDVFFEASDGVRLHALHLHHSAADTATVYFHGNAGNVYHRLRDLRHLRDIGTSVLALSYRGYGKSDGSPDEAGLYRDAEAAYAYATKTLGYQPSRIFLLGRSLGSTTATELAQGKALAGVILISPLSSAADQAGAMGLGFAAGLAGKAFDNVSKITRLEAPLLIVHGTFDQVIPIAMGRKVYEAAPGDKTFRTFEGVGHNNLSSQFAGQYWQAISAFILQHSESEPATKN